MKLTVQVKVDHDVIYSIDLFDHTDFVANKGKGFVGFNKEQDTCVVWGEWPNNKVQSSYGQYAYRIKNDKLQYFHHNNWNDFHNSLQEDYQMKKADSILLEVEDE